MHLKEVLFYVVGHTMGEDLNFVTLKIKCKAEELQMKSLQFMATKLFH